MTDEWLKRRLELERLLGIDALVRARAAAAPVDDRQAVLNELAVVVSTCTKCRLHAGRTQTVFGCGSAHAALMFVGEAPGHDEDVQGVPFVGAAGKLLDRMIYAMGLERDEVYICNILKCRPPNNRDPRPDEAESCFPYLERQIELVAPRIICTLGRPASCTLLGTDAAMGAMRGRWHEFRGIPLMPTYHPAYLLRSPGQKAKAWSDLKQIVIALAQGVSE